MAGTLDRRAGDPVSLLWDCTYSISYKLEYVYRVGTRQRGASPECWALGFTEPVTLIALTDLCPDGRWGFSQLLRRSLQFTQESFDLLGVANHPLTVPNRGTGECCFLVG